MPLISHSLPGEYRPFLANSPWNTPIAADAQTHPDSELILEHMRTKSNRLMMSRNYTIPVNVVNHLELSKVRPLSDRIFDWYDRDKNGVSDVDVPWHPDMLIEQTSDGHCCIVDPFVGMAWEMSRCKPGNPPTCTTLNMWNLRLSGVGDNPNEVITERWWARGGRGSGFPEIAGLMRREQITMGEIPHALVFTFTECRKADDGSKIFIHPPACRSDGDFVGRKYPVQGMRFQLVADENDFRRWGLTEQAKIVARALVKYGMLLGDKGGDWKIQPQLLDKTIDGQIDKWVGMYADIEKIPTDAGKWRIVYTGPATIKRG